MTYTESEIVSQPGCWQRAAALASEYAWLLPRDGERVAVTGCGTSWFVAQCYSALRERAGRGETDAFTSSEFPVNRHYDRVLALSRSGTTTEVLSLLAALRERAMPTMAVTADGTTPIVGAAEDAIVLDFADERSVVQTRFATSTLALLRAHLGEDITTPVQDATGALDADTADLVTAEQFTFLGTGWTIGLAAEAALKMREAAGAWTESYPAMEYRHGPISIAAPGRVVWVFGPVPGGMARDVAATGARLVTSDADPMADLIRVQRLAVAIAAASGKDPDKPRNLMRSVILDSPRRTDRTGPSARSPQRHGRR